MSKRPIVILHGWSDTSASFTALRNYVASLDLGTPVVINLADYVSMDDAVRFDDLVAGMQRAWLKVGLPLAPRAVDAIVHSTGGLVIRDWLDTHFAPDASPVHRLLMLAPANFGSHLAHKGHSFIGRVVKGFKSDKPFQTGLRLLKGLELASPYTWQLALRDRFGSANRFEPGRVLCTVLVGNVGYSGIAAAANEDGSDGTVRASTANLNCARLSIDFSSDPLNPVVSAVRRSGGRTAFRILDGDNHSTAAMKDRGPKDSDGRRLIAGALRVTDAAFDAWCDACEGETLAITARAEQQDDHERVGYQNTVVRVVDDAGAS
ncbi:MAG: alpha/beta hydrolase, partial [Verrucomicrobia bacterium]|nr:alpha/beta hydrolase [Verrucomicrobiota bacterium]